MAKQHFYSRVPAAGSLYNNADGFDTFAQSQGLSREFVQKELSGVYENKLGKRDAEAVRAGTMPYVYSQSVMPSGDVVHSCVTYFPNDYTGERSGYLCHSLVLSEEEKQQIFFGTGVGLLNPRMFKIKAFDYVNQVADGDYPEKEYTPVKKESAKSLQKHYDTGAMKGFVYALLSVLFAKGKTVYFRLPYEEHEVSEQALRFMNAIVTIVPPQWRKNISFVTYVTEPSQYSNIKLKCISERFPEASLSKGIFVDFNADVVLGLPADDVVAKAPVNFFYSLLGDKQTREEFFQFLDQAIGAMPELSKMTMKTLSDLVFLFGGTNGRFVQDKILPEDEDVASFLATYEKYREALNQELRFNAYRCLDRYVKNQVAIPKNVFNRLTRLYPQEQPALKTHIMDGVLELIHTDAMRDKLFAFLKVNYESEDPQTRAKISSDLCRVFYGGFLQVQILDFFSQCFTQENPEIREAIFDKLMLAIRTESVQQKIMSFVETNYEVLTHEQKQRFYGEVFTFLPACDELSAVLICQINRQLETEEDAYRVWVAEKLVTLLAEDYEKEEHLLMPIMCAETGFCRELVQKIAFGPGREKALFDEYLELLSQVEALEKTHQLAVILRHIPGEATEDLLCEAVERLYACDTEKTDIYRWFEIETVLGTEIAPLCETLAQRIRESIIEPAVVCRTEDVFDVTLRVDGPKVLKRYAAENPYLAESKQYAVFFDTVRMTDAIREGKAAQVLQEMAVILARGGDHSKLSSYIEERMLDWEEQSLNKAVLCQMCSSVLRSGSFLADDVYGKAKEKCTPYMPEDLLKRMKAKVTDKSAEMAGASILKVLVFACRTDKVLARIIYRDKENLRNFLLALRKDYGRDMDKWLEETLDRAPAQFTAIIEEILKAYKPEPLLVQVPFLVSAVSAVKAILPKRPAVSYAKPVIFEKVSDFFNRKLKK